VPQPALETSLSEHCVATSHLAHTANMTTHKQTTNLTHRPHPFTITQPTPHREMVILGTQYAGEMKKGVFS
jgi:ATP-dependent phosphoenolpyruvate carboxykinase